MIKRQTFDINPLQTMSWLNDRLIDWSDSGAQYLMDGTVEKLGPYSFAFPFDSAVTSDNGIYSVIYQKLGTKGLLLKNGQQLREINRSYYQAHVYEYPIAFATAQNGQTYLIHCPHKYCQIDFEDVETGEILTDKEYRQPADFFHSRLELSPDNKTLISKGWGWHPYDFIHVFDVEAALKNPLLLDKSQLEPLVDAEICAASFINNDLILLGSFLDSEPFDDEPSEKMKNGQIAVWNIRTNKITQPITPNFKIDGHLTAINDTFAWSLYDFPKIINFKTGLIEDKIEDISSGQQISAIIWHLSNLPKIAFNRSTKQVAIYQNDKIEVLSI